MVLIWLKQAALWVAECNGACRVNKNLLVKRLLRNLWSKRGDIKTTNAWAMFETTGEGGWTGYLLNQ